MTLYKCEKCSFEFYFHETEGVRFCPKCGQESVKIPPLEVKFLIHSLEVNEREKIITAHYAMTNARDSYRNRKMSSAELKVVYD